MRIEPFQIDVAPQVLADLAERLRRTRWPDPAPAPGWEQGVPLGWLQDLCAYWADGFDWPSVQARLNAVPQFSFTGDDDDAPLHFLHVPSANPGAVPLVLTVGWPSTFAEVLPALDALAEDFHVVVPTLPGFGFSAPSARPVEDLWADLMTALGYPRFLAAGSDWGAEITHLLGRRHPDRVLGLHFSSPDFALPGPLPEDLSAEERTALGAVDEWKRTDGAYAAVHRTRAQTIGHALTDSPAGLAAWLLEKVVAWSGDDSFTRDDLLTTATLYWVSGAVTSLTIYGDEAQAARARLEPGERVKPPIGVLTFPHGAEPNLPRSLAERSYEVLRWTESPRGGHFPAFQTPELLAAELKELKTLLNRSVR